MSLNDVVQLNITRDAPAVSRAGFGTLLFLGSNATGWDTDRIRSYTKAADLLEDGFETSDPEYKAAVKAFSQELRPRSIKIGLRLTAVAQVKTFTPNVTVQSIAHYIVTLNGVVFDFTSDADPTATEVVTGLKALINAGDEPVTASGTTTLILTADEAGIGFTATGSTNMPAVATTANVGVVEDLAAISDIDDDWYGLAIESRDVDVILAAAGYIESVRKLFIACNGDAAVIAAGSSDIASRLQALGYARTAYLYSADHANYPEVAWFGGQLPEAPGSSTYKFKALVGITADSLTSTQESVAKAKGANVYTSVGGSGMTAEGKVAEGEFIDVIVGIDWIYVNMQADVLQIFRNEKKVPYTDPGAASIVSAVQNRLNAAIPVGILAADPAPTTSVPLVKDVSPENKAARLLPDITFDGTLAGAIHAVAISGNVSV